ncbi:MAG: WD40/YVTN/BNR-like repeat-containing protein [Bacilli bacterium]
MKSKGKFRTASIALVTSAGIVLPGCGITSAASLQQSSQHIVQKGVAAIRTRTAATPAAHNGKGPHLLYLKMFNQNDGWGVYYRAVLHTVNGWRTWAEVNPPGVQPISNHAVYFGSPQHAWLAAKGKHHSLAIWYTHDGGVRWREYTVIPPFAVGSGGTFFSFLSSKDGWLLVNGIPALAASPEALYRTSDGGQRWTLVRNYGWQNIMDIHFLTKHVGYERGGDANGGMGSLFYTHDGGWSWSPVRIPVLSQKIDSKLPKVVLTQGPVFFGSRYGVVPVAGVVGTNYRRAGLLRTVNGGHTWTLGSTKSTPDSFGVMFSLLSQNALIMGVPLPLDHGATFFISKNLGRDWTYLGRTEEPVSSIQFLSPTLGWALTNNGLPVITKDGGSKWNAG